MSGGGGGGRAFECTISEALEAPLTVVRVRDEVGKSDPPGGGGTELTINSAFVKVSIRKELRSETGISAQSRGCKLSRALCSSDMVENCGSLWDLGLRLYESGRVELELGD